VLLVVDGDGAGAQGQQQLLLTHLRTQYNTDASENLNSFFSVAEYLYDGYAVCSFLLFVTVLKDTSSMRTISFKK
jgi:hypothetical protein